MRRRTLMLMLGAAAVTTAVALVHPRVGDARSRAIAAGVQDRGTAPQTCRGIVIGHRGASGLRPEHTLASYALAIDQGADFIEPDLVVTSDGILVARHENDLTETTDVADHPEFAARRTTKLLDGEEENGWYAEDFTLAELKTLRAKERIPSVRPANTAFDGMFEVPTLQEIIDLVKAKSAALGRTIGLYPEVKHPTYFRGIGLPLEQRVVDVLHQNGYRGATAPIFIQSFEVGSLRTLVLLTDLPLVQLINTGERPYDWAASGDPRTYADMMTPAGLAEIATYARGIGPNKDLIVPRDDEGNLLAPTDLIERAHAAGLVVHAWTFRNEDRYLPTGLGGHPEAEYELFLRLGLDGVFSDFPATAHAARCRDNR